MKTKKLFFERLDKVFDALNENNIKINENLFRRYTNFSYNYLDKVEDLVKSINKKRYLNVYLDNEKLNIPINSIKYYSTYQYSKLNNNYFDVYIIEYQNNLKEYISSEEILYMTNSNGLKRNNGSIIFIDNNLINI